MVLRQTCVDLSVVGKLQCLDGDLSFFAAFSTLRKIILRKDATHAAN